jgi:hypothetical protein
MSDLNKAILKVAKKNPEFAQALARELKQPSTHRKQGDVENKMRQGFYGAYSLLERMEKETQGFDLTRERYDGSAQKLEDLKTLAMKIQVSLDSGIGALEKFDVWIKNRKALITKRQKYLIAVTDELSKTAPDSVSNSSGYLKHYWTPNFKWSGSNGAKSIYLNFDPSFDHGGEFLDTSFIYIEPNSGGVKSFRIKNPKNPKRAAQTIWDQLAQQGVA